MNGRGGINEKNILTIRHIMAMFAIRTVISGVLAGIALLSLSSCGAKHTPTPSPTPAIIPTTVPTPTPTTPPPSVPALIPFIVPPIRVNIIVEGAEAEVTVYGNPCKPPCSLDIEVGDQLLIDVKDPPLQVGSRYIFTGWSDGGERRHEVRPISSTTYTAYFKRQYELVVTSPYGMATGGGWYDKGTQVTPSVTPTMIETRSETRRLHTGWSEALPVAMTGPKTITATWKTQYRLAVRVVGSGTVNPSGGWFDEGASVTLTPSPLGPEWWFDSFSVPFPVVMNTPKEVTAYFARETVTLSTAVNPPGAGSISPNGGTHKNGAHVTLTAIPIPGWYFSSWRGDVSDIHNPLTITMNTSKEVTANFFRYSPDVPMPKLTPAGPAPLAISIVPTQPVTASMVLVSGTGWAPGNAVFWDLSKAGAVAPSASSHVFPRDDGSFTAIVTLPPDLEANTVGSLIAFDTRGNKATITFKIVSGPSITVSPSAIKWGDTLNIAGRGFTASTNMRYGLPWEGISSTGSFSPAVRTDTTGSFVARAVVPTLSKGIRTIGVTDGVNVATAFIDVLETPVGNIRF